MSFAVFIGLKVLAKHVSSWLNISFVSNFFQSNSFIFITFRKTKYLRFVLFFFYFHFKINFSFLKFCGRVPQKKENDFCLKKKESMISL